MMKTFALLRKLLQAALGECKLQAVRNSEQEIRNTKPERENAKPEITTCTYNSFPCNENNDPAAGGSFLFWRKHKTNHLMNASFQISTSTPNLFSINYHIMKKNLRKSSLYAIALTIAGLFFVSFVSAQTATLTSDQADYAPGSTATLTGSGFAPGETVTLLVVHADFLMMGMH